MYATECTTKKLIVSETQVLKRETDTFRLRFRIPFAIFELLLVETTKWLRSTNKLEGDGTDACGRDIFFTCVALHNMIHTHDGRHEWESGVEWGGRDGLFEDDEHEHWSRPTVLRANGVRSKVEEGEDFSRFGSVHFQHGVLPPGDAAPVEAGSMGNLDVDALVELHTESQDGFNDLQAKLVAHYDVRYKARTVEWLRSSAPPSASDRRQSRGGAAAAEE